MINLKALYLLRSKSDRQPPSNAIALLNPLITK
jgi:hypothetical protein